MSWLKGGPFLEVSFLHILNEGRENLVQELTEKLKASFDHFEIAIDSNILQGLISQFDTGYPFDEKAPDSYLIHSIQIPIYLTIEGRRKSVLSLEQVSDSLIVVDFWFFGSEWDAPEWDQIGIKDFQIEGFKKFLKDLYNTIQFPFGMIEVENDVKGIFDTDAGWPHESYNLENINEKWINEYMMSIVKNGFLKSDSLNVSSEINGGKIIEKKTTHNKK